MPFLQKFAKTKQKITISLRKIWNKNANNSAGSGPRTKIALRAGLAGWNFYFFLFPGRKLYKSKRMAPEKLPLCATEGSRAGPERRVIPSLLLLRYDARKLLIFNEKESGGDKKNQPKLWRPLKKKDSFYVGCFFSISWFALLLPPSKSN